MRKPIKRKLFLWIIIISVLFIILNYNKLLSPIKNFFFRITEKPRSASYDLSQGMDSYFYYVFHYKEIKNKIEDINKQLSEKIIDYAQLEQLKEENAVLKNELAYVKSSNFKFVTGEVVSGFNLDSGNIVRINIGKEDGVFDDLPVLYNGVLIGTILKADDHFSDVMLLSDRNSLISVSILGEEKISGILSGNLANAMEMHYIPLDSKVKQGDIIISSGFEEHIPRGLVIGHIKELSFSDGDYFKTAIIYPFFDINFLNFVNVMIIQ
ncbi:MAG TPA: rod shape-determining protein MreC [bacterium]|jgi:rod shape-determining protein MreC|nr:rod shape-determining protein MreC [bacterium]HOG38186.1 rod shape-determining protein MreC [bacterium]HQI03224.1 rod shape-determining protein MreC [bacterium]